MRAAAELICVTRPVIYAGGGILKRVPPSAARVAELRRAFVTRDARTLSRRHPLALGMPGMHGNYTAVTAMQESDLLIALGSRFDDRVTGKVPAFAPDAKIIHVDIDPAELGKVRRADVGIQGDCRIAIERLIQAIRELGGPAQQPDRTEWKARISGWRENFAHLRPSQPATNSSAYVLETLRDNPDDTIVVRASPASDGTSLLEFKYP